MAKGKHATALFEVMNKTRFAGGRNGSSSGGGGGIPTPKWWFKSSNGGGGNSGGGNAAVAEAPESPMEATSDYEVEVPVRAAPVVMPPLASSSSIEVPGSASAPTTAVTPPRAQPVAVSVDSDRQLINLRMSYTSALICGFGVFIALAIAVLIGKGLTRGPSPAIANTSTQQLKQRPPTPGVLNVPRRSEQVSGGSNDTGEGSGPRVASGTISTGTRNPQQSFNDPRPPATFFTDDAHRQNGLNYAIIQSYPDKETAERAAEFLTKSGIPCTVERNLPNWKLPWPTGCAVVGIRGFAKVSNNPALDAYRKSIMEVSSKFTNGRSRFAGFAVSMYSWKNSN
jgi:hypothetical protein